VKLLSVAIDRLTQWSLPGLLCIGDAAHAMSPVGGVGINLAIQDAVASANLLADKLLAPGPLGQDDLDAVRRRRLWPTKATQALQTAIQRNVFVPVIEATAAPKVPLPMAVVSHVPALQRLSARLLGMGLRPERVASPSAAKAPAT
ncbi:MAG: FAD-dependent monooxygenase, partial [Rubrivivax sp.]